MKNIKLLAFDIDGTLIPRTRETISENTKKAIRECEKKGIKVIISTGRCSYLIQKDALESIDSDYVITINGALITDGKLSTIKKSQMSKETFNHIIDEAIKNDVAVGFKFEDAIAVYHKYHEYISIYLKGKERADVINYEEKRDYHISHGMPLGAFLIGENERLYKVREAIPEMTWVVAYDKGMECFNKDVSKANGIQYVLDKLNLSFDEVMAFGDSENDIEMIKAAAIGIAMGNATDDVKDAADYITLGCEEDGIVHALKHYGIIK